MPHETSSRIAGTATPYEGAPVSQQQTLYGVPTGVTSSLVRGDLSTSLVEELLAKYRATPPAPPPKPNKIQMTIGILGDALQAYAQVRSGGTASGQGPFISGLMRRQQEYQAKLAEFENQRQRGLENLLKIQELTNYRQAQLDRDELRRLLQENKQSGFLTQEVDEANNPINVRYVTDSTGNVIRREVLGKRPVAEIVVPGATGFQVVNRPTATARPVTGDAETPSAGQPILPVPPVGAVQRTGFLEAGKGIFTDFRKLASDLVAKGVNFPATFGQERLRIGRAGRVLSGMINPDVEQLIRQKELLGEAITNILTGAQVAEQQIQRLINQLPDPSLLATPNGREAFTRALNDAEGFFNTLLETNTRGFPGLASPTSRAGQPTQSQSSEIQNLSDDELLRLLNAPE